MSLTFQIFPISTKIAPLRFPDILFLYSRFREILKFASLNSFILLLLPGPSLYAFHALLSFDPPPKNDSENGILLELPNGTAIPPKYLKAKVELSSATQTEINLPFITADKTGPKHINLKFTRAKLEALVENLVNRTLEPCKTALKDSGFSAAEIDEVVLVGGMTRMPKIVETVKNFFGKEVLKGELTVVLSSKNKKSEKPNIADIKKLSNEIKQYLKRYSVKDVVNLISQKNNLSKKKIYDICLRIKKK